MLAQPRPSLRRALPWWGLITIGSSLLSATPAVAETEAADWFRYDDGVTAAWEIRSEADDPLRFDLRRRGIDGRAPAKRVLVLYPKPSSAYDTAISEILEVFLDREVDAELTALNFQDDDAKGAAALRMAEDRDYDLILSMGSQSTAWLHQHYRGGSIPVVSVCSKDPVTLGQMDGYDRGSGTNFAFTSLNMAIDVQLAYLIDFLPRLRNLAILVNSQNVSAMRTQAEPMARLARARGIHVMELAVQDPENARQELAELVRSAVMAMRDDDPRLERSIFWITGSTAVFREIATINANADRVPVLSVVPEVVKAGDASAVMSIGISFESNARLAAAYAVDILSGQSLPGDLPVGVVTPPDIAINFRRAREIGLDIPLDLFESATYVYDYEGRPVRDGGDSVPSGTGS